MFESAYRQRLASDLARWQSDGVITSATGDAIRTALPPMPRAVNIPTVVGIVGGLLIAAAFLAFVAANWTEIARPARFAILIAGIVGSYGIGAFFDRSSRPYLADISATVGSIVFGASIALVGQMYHLAEDFAAGMMLWSAVSLLAAILTGSRGALAVALAAGCFWSGTRVTELGDAPHVPFVAFWFAGAVLAVIWNSPVARHLVGAAALGWLLTIFIGTTRQTDNPIPLIVGSAALLLGGGLTLSSLATGALRALGVTLSTYAAFALAIVLAPVGIEDYVKRILVPPAWSLVCGFGGISLAFGVAVAGRCPGSAFAGLALVFAMIVATGWAGSASVAQPWTTYAMVLVSMLCLVVSGMLDDVRPRVVAGWIGLGLMIAGITWAVKGSLLKRAVFLAASGIAAVVLAALLSRLVPKEEEGR
ncbi:MAG TPA: DUF2157 domain-containing protein [Xanthobacteraceae bacterium]|jgi:uncharacterized membrane protein